MLEEKLTKNFPQHGFEITVWYKEIRGEFHVWNYTVKDEQGRMDHERIREYYWTVASGKMTLEQVVYYIADLVSDLL